MNTYVPSQKTTSQSAIANTHTHAHTLTQGGIEALVAAMDRHEESSGVQEQAAGALRNLAANHPENQRKISAQLANALKVHLSLPGKVYE